MPFRQNTALLIFAGLIVATLAAWFVWAPKKPPAPPTAAAHPQPAHVRLGDLTLVTVQQGSFRELLPFDAKVVPNDIVYLDALEGGHVERLLVGPGDMVTAGQPLIEFRNTTLELDVLDRESRLIASISQLQNYQTVLEQNRINNEKELARIDYDITRLERSILRRNELAAKGAEAEELKDSVQDELDYDRRMRPMQAESNAQQNELRLRQLPEIKKQLDMLEQDLKISRGKLEDLTVRAPIAGRVTAIDLKIGQNRNRGERLAEITPYTGYQLSADFDESQFAQLHVGQDAVAHIADKDWPLRISRIYPQITAHKFTVNLTFAAGSPSGLVPGLGVSGALTVGVTNNLLLLPAGNAVRHDREDWVYLLTEDGHAAHRQPVKIGRRNGQQIEIVSGIAAGARVIASGAGDGDGMAGLVIEN